jgi:hypothetical protein
MWMLHGVSASYARSSCGCSAACCLNVDVVFASANSASGTGGETWAVMSLHESCSTSKRTRIWPWPRYHVPRPVLVSETEMGPWQAIMPADVVACCRPFCCVALNHWRKSRLSIPPPSIHLSVCSPCCVGTACSRAGRTQRPVGWCAQVEPTSPGHRRYITPKTKHM